MIKQNLAPVLTQSLTMTAQLQQALQLLQCSNQELAFFVYQQLHTNPLLEVIEPSTEVISWEEQSDIPFNSVDCYQNMWNSAPSLQESSSEIPFVSSPSLEIFILDQIKNSFSNKEERIIAFSMVPYLTECGYLSATLDHVAQHLNQPLSRLEAVLRKLQGLEPLGVFARSLKECLMLQLIDRQMYNEKWAILLDHLEYIAKDKIPLIVRAMKKVGGTVEIIDQMISQLKKLNPKPGNLFHYSENSSVIPDLIMDLLPYGGWKVRMNPKNRIKVRLNHDYVTELQVCCGDKEAQRYIKEKINQGQWLIHNIDQRSSTLKKVAEVIIHQQQDFFFHGKAYLKTLTLKDVAQQTDLHESTISRATQGKYILTPQGNFPLKYFFSYGRQGFFSPESIKFALQQFIVQEKLAQSDEQLMTLLSQKKGIKISRRTVAKYRKELKFPSSFKRKRVK